MLSPWISLSELVAEFLSANAKGRESLRVFINTWLGEPWEERGARVEPHTLVSRCESYAGPKGEPADVPAWASVLTAGVDVQADGFALQVQAWGPGQERAVVDWQERIEGDPKIQETQDRLIQALEARYRHVTGHALPIAGTCLDTGFSASDMYDLVRRNQGRFRLWGCKGHGGRMAEPLVLSRQKKQSERPLPIKLINVNADAAKDDVLRALSLVQPGPGYLHFPQLAQIDEEFFAQLCAEHKETKYNKNGVGVGTIWVQDRPRNEGLDTAALALVAFRLLNLSNARLAQMRELLEKTPVDAGRQAPPGSGGGSPRPAPAAPPPPRPRVPRTQSWRPPS
jgi:phage terminase large subunit GpA-like protein